MHRQRRSDMEANVRKYTNQKAVKQFILEKVKKIRVGWDCTRVSRDALVSFELKAVQLVRSFDGLKTNRTPETELLVKSAVAKTLVDCHRVKYPCFKVTAVSNDAIKCIEAELERHIISSVQSHPTLGHTFKV